MGQKKGLYGLEKYYIIIWAMIYEKMLRRLSGNKGIDKEYKG